MNMKTIAITALLASALVGCGGKAKPAVTQAPKDAATDGGAADGAAKPGATELPANPCAEKKP
jgi:hypothetical protein